MQYELRIGGKPVGRYATEEEAEARARELVRTNPDCDPEIMDTCTGRAAVPAGSKRWRDELATKVGF